MSISDNSGWSSLMRVAVIVITMLAAMMPSQASVSCVSRGETFRCFDSAQVCRHGPDRGGDAASARCVRIDRAEQSAPPDVVLVLLGFLLTLATIEVLFRGSTLERPPSRGNRPLA